MGNRAGFTAALMSSASLRIIRKDTSGFQRLRRDVPNGIDRLARAAAQGITDDIKQSMGTSPPGITYERYNPKRTHTASQPGYPPNVDLGNLRDSMNWFSERKGRTIVHDGVVYGIDLELGNPATNLEPRPFVVPVFEQWQRAKLMELARTMGIL